MGNITLCNKSRTVNRFVENECSIKTYTVYFVRHGEATHNVLEKEAQAKAKESAIGEGYAPCSHETLERMENARKEILNDVTLQDCPLTEQGKEEARFAKQSIAEICARRDLPIPTQVLVSPLQRALQTADLVFPGCHDIHVREDLQERQTGKACDTRTSSTVTSRRKTFERFSFNGLLLLSTRRKLAKDHVDVEEKRNLRERTYLLFKLLLEIEHPTVAVVAHKGYLRELERGPLGHKNAKQFENCEVRVYRISVNTDAPTKDMLHVAERIA